jgi:hypothetical protein
MGAPATMPLTKLEEMMMRLGPGRSKGLRRVALKPSRLDQLLPVGYSPNVQRAALTIEMTLMALMFTLENMCQHRPDITIKVLGPYFGYHVNIPTLEGALLHCLLASKPFRNKEHLEIVPSQRMAMMISFRDDMMHLEQGAVPSPNVIYYPFDEDFQADVGDFIGGLWRTTKFSKPLAAHALRQVHDWILDGI